MMDDNKIDEAASDNPEINRTSRAAAAFPIVGVGASAGGVDALQRFFAAVQPDCGMGFVVVQHLDPEHNSVLTEVLARSCPLPVTRIEDEARVEINHVHVIPPNASLSISDGSLLLGRPHRQRGHRDPIDEFFASLAVDQGENAACIILSGTGSDGTLGLRAVKENGGLTLAQADAEYDGMMRSAVSTGLVDDVLSVEDMPQALADYFSHVRRSDPDGVDALNPPIREHLGRIFGLLRSHTGHDFSDYKDKTIIRRVQRRMHVLQIDEMAAFVDRLQHDPQEVVQLFHDLLIGVTNFFRDPEAFAALEHTIIPRLFHGKGADDTIRVWVPGCATGEEAYSIAMLLRDAVPSGRRAPKLQIFASDIDEHALELARLGRFPATIANDITPRRLARYFLREDGTYRIASDLREICLFSNHNMLRDAPFSKLDLVSCRNLLIYLGPDLQDRVIPLFHYALNPNGYLFLGTSENVTRHPRLFVPVEKVHRIFQRRAHAERTLPHFPLSAPDPTRSRRHHHGTGQQPQASLREAAERSLLEQYAPPYVVINQEGDLLQTSARTGRYLELPAGAPDTNIFSLARPGLRLELRAALQKAIATGQAAVQPHIAFSIDGRTQQIDVVVQPIRYAGTAYGLYLVVFQELAGVVEVADAAEGGDAESAGMLHMEAQLQSARERLQTATEELESSNEELKSSNEELSSMNEELQAANEELETSKEELQSINEELQTVNAELHARVEELSRANNDMANLLNSTQIATVFLDRDLAIKSFTPAAKELFRLVESDAGRPITHVRARFELPTLMEDAETVLRTLGSIERPVNSNETDARYVMRILPYMTAENVINGVVITFTDITRITIAEARIEELTRALRNRADSLETLLDLVPVGVLIAEAKDRPVLVNQYGARLLGAPTTRKGLRPVVMGFRLSEGDKPIIWDDQPLQRAARTGEPVPGFEGRLESADGNTANVMISATPLFDEAGAVRGAIAGIVDISVHKAAQAKQEVLLHELQHRVKNILATVSSLITRMGRRAASVEDFGEGLLARLSAMGLMQDLLSRATWQGVHLRSLATAALAPYSNPEGDNIVLDGSDVALRPNAAATLGMVLHELTTNAAKYGALSVPSGTVEINWDTVPSSSELRLTWTERNGPAVAPNSTAGFGTSFVQRSVEHELQGKAELDFSPSGLRCVITFPLVGNAE